MPAPITGATDTMQVRFDSDNSATNDGFAATVVCSGAAGDPCADDGGATMAGGKLALPFVCVYIYTCRRLIDLSV